MKLVLDASMALAWLFERNQPEEADCADRMLIALADAETSVPSLWHTEIINALLVGERRRVVTEAQVIDYLNRLSLLPISTDNSAPENRRDSVMALAREYELTAYDATYLDLALRADAILATFDVKLAKAMRRAGGKVFEDIKSKTL
jgi:predicted nucleic acid-binding protein